MASTFGRSWKSPRRLSLKGRLLLLVLVLVIPAIGAAGLALESVARQGRVEVERHLGETARALSLVVDRQLGQAQAVLWALAAAPSLAEGDLAAFDVLARRSLHIPDSWIVLERLDGSQLVNTRTGPGLPPPDARVPKQGIELPTETPAVGNLMRRSENLPVVSVDLRVRMADSDQYLLRLIMRTRALSQILADQSLPDTWVGAILDRRGTVVARSRDGERFAGSRATPDVLARLDGAAASQVFESVSLDGVPTVLAISRSPASGWSALVAVPRTELTTQSALSLAYLAVTGVLLLAGGTIFAILLGRQLLRPIHALAGDARNVAAAVARDGPLPPLGAAPSTVEEFEDLRRGFVAAVEALNRRTEAARASEEMLRMSQEAGQIGGYERDFARDELRWTDESYRIFGLAPEAPGRVPRARWRAALHPEDQARIEGEIAAALAAQSPEIRLQYRILRADTGELRHLEARSRYFYDAAGRPERAVGAIIDVTKLRAEQERRELLAREVDHRAKNALAVVQSVVRLTRADDPKDFVKAVEGRIAALARAHTLLAREHWRGADLRTLVEEELAPYRAADSVAIEGASLRILPEAVQPLSMVVHELATNAAKHGALSVTGGRLRVGWGPAAGGRFQLLWTETDGPPVLAPPVRRGFGSRVIQATAEEQLGGAVAFQWRAAGLVCRIDVPAARLVDPSLGPGEERGADAPAEAAAATSLAGRVIMVAEDEVLLAMEMKENLERWGCRVVGPAGTLDEALALAAKHAHELDAAVLDVNLQGRASFPVAELLSRAAVAVIYSSGYGDLPAAMPPAEGRPVLLRKPLAPEQLAAALRRAMGGQASAA